MITIIQMLIVHNIIKIVILPDNILLIVRSGELC